MLIKYPLCYYVVVELRWNVAFCQAGAICMWGRGNFLVTGFKSHRFTCFPSSANNFHLFLQYPLVYPTNRTLLIVALSSFLYRAVVGLSSSSNGDVSQFINMIDARDVVTVAPLKVAFEPRLLVDRPK